MDQQNNETYSRLTGTLSFSLSQHTITLQIVELGVVLIALLLTSFVENHTDLAIEYAKAVLSAILLVVMVPVLNFLALYFVQNILQRGILFAMRQIEVTYHTCEQFVTFKNAEPEIWLSENEHLMELHNDDYEEYMGLSTITEESSNDNTHISTMSNFTRMTQLEVNEFAGDGDGARNKIHERLLDVEQTTMHQKHNERNKSPERTFVFDYMGSKVPKARASSECDGVVPVDLAIAEDGSDCEETESSSRDALPIEDYAVPIDTYHW